MNPQVLSYFTAKLEASEVELSVNEVLEIIKQGAHQWSHDRLKVGVNCFSWLRNEKRFIILGRMGHFEGPYFDEDVRVINHTYLFYFMAEISGTQVQICRRRTTGGILHPVCMVARLPFIEPLLELALHPAIQCSIIGLCSTVSYLRQPLLFCPTPFLPFSLVITQFFLSRDMTRIFI